MKSDEPILDTEDLLGLVDPDLKRPLDVREVIGRITDGSRFEEFKPLFGPTLICGFAKPHIKVGPNKGLNSSNLDPSVIRPITSLTSRGLFKSGSTNPRRSSVSKIGSSDFILGSLPSFLQFK